MPLRHSNQKQGLGKSMTVQTSILASALVLAAAATSMAQDVRLPERETAVPATTDGVPHVQIGVKPNPIFSKMLMDHVEAFPGVNLGATRVSLPGAVGFQLADGMSLAHPEVIVGGREFAHLHPDGSLHASLVPELAKEAVRTGWAISHPWAFQRDGWEGFVMIYTPQTDQELDVVIRLVEQSYMFVTGRALDG